MIAGAVAIRKVRKYSGSHDARILAVMAAGVGISFLVHGTTDNLLTQAPLLYPLVVPLSWVFVAARSPQDFDDYGVAAPDTDADEVGSAEEPGAIPMLS